MTLFIQLAIFFYLYKNFSVAIKLLNLPINWITFIGLTIFFLVFSEVYVWLTRRFKIWISVLLFLISIVISFLLTPQITSFIGLEKFKSYEDFYLSVIEGIKNYYWLIMSSAFLTAIADQILHWVLFGFKGKSSFTLLTSLNGILLDEIAMRFLVLGFLLSFNVELNVAIFLQALTYALYYLDPFSKSRLRQAGLNMIHGIIAATLTLAYGWFLSVAMFLIRSIVWLAENKLGI